jgi:hypothetical protein
MRFFILSLPGRPALAESHGQTDFSVLESLQNTPDAGFWFLI